MTQDSPQDHNTPAMTPEQTAHILEKAKKDAEVFLRDEWQARQREVLFGPGGLLIIGALLSICVGPIFDLDITTLAIGVGGIILASMVWTALRWRCPRCEKIPLQHVTLLVHKVYTPTSCPHCGLSLMEDESAS